MRAVPLSMFAVALAAQPALADDQSGDVLPQEDTRADREWGFFELTGAYGFQFGTTEYIPDASTTEFMHPLVNGFGIGTTAALAVARDVYVIANYEYTKADSRTGSIPNAVEEIEGNISYQTATVGMRIGRSLGAGMIYGELAFGVVLPFEVERRFQYDPALSQLPEPIMGVGTRRDEYSLGPGAHGLLGYRIPLGGPAYFATSVKLKSFESENNGERTVLDNFVTDFDEQPPQPVSGVIEYSKDGGMQPSTFSVQDVRLQLSVGTSF